MEIEAAHIHEAAHAFIAHYYNIPLDRVRVSLGAGYGGTTRLDQNALEQWPKEERGSLRKALLAVWSAGKVAEEKWSLNPPDPTHWEGDKQTVRELYKALGFSDFSDGDFEAAANVVKCVLDNDVHWNCVQELARCLTLIQLSGATLRNELRDFPQGSADNLLF